MSESGSDMQKRNEWRPWVVVAVALGAVCLYLGWDGLYFLRTPPSPVPAPVQVHIIPGTSLRQVAATLEDRGLVLSSWRFLVLVRLRGLGRQIKAGEYQFTTAMLPGSILGKLARGEVVLHPVTFPEGLTMREMAMILERRHLGSARDFIAAATDAALARSFGIPAASLEGYLFPDTYLLPRDLAASAIVRLMLERFQQNFTARDQRRARELGLSRHQVVILASIVEKETAVPAERPLIAGVFLNRLRRNIPLQSDPTVIYGLTHFDGNLTREHLRTDTPYNTYTRRGLPAGPICNPGADAIKAVLYPANTDYLYFVAKQDGTHHFSATLKEHNAAVRRYQKRR